MNDLGGTPNSDETPASNGAPRWRSRGAAGAAAVGIGLISGGTALAVYSRFFASAEHLDDRMADGSDWFGSFRAPVAGVPVRFATAAILLGVALIAVAVAVAVRGGRARAGSGRAGVFALAVLACVAVWGGFAVRAHLPGMWDSIRFDYPWFAQLPTALAATALVLIGGVLMLGLALYPVNVRRIGRGAMATLIAVGLAVAAGVAVLAVRAGDDDANVDHSTAASVTIPPVPRRLGNERYRVALPVQIDARDANRKRAADVVVAGAGFVVASTEGLTAFDGATGQPRWHYLRKNVRRGDQLGVEYIRASLMSADGGSVVLARWDNKGWVALDAVTGAVLWTDSEFTRRLPDPDLSSASEKNPWRIADDEFRPTARYLVLTDGSHIERYDARTGARMWSADGCGDRRQEVAVTDPAIYRITHCVNGNEMTITANALDPGTGTVTATRELTRLATENAPRVFTRTIANTVVIDWFSDSVRMRGSIVVDRPAHLTTAPDTTASLHPLAADPNSDEILVSRPTQPVDVHAYQVVSIDGTVKYPVDGIQEDYIHSSSDDIFLADELVQAAHYDVDGGSRTEVRVWSRTDGSRVAAYPLSPGDGHYEITMPMAAPGAVLILCIGPKNVDLIGFAPGA
ncbi:PQQ-binding-like beta-propeller repeat protein [Nocardia sp. NPDC052566]|uniref:outer membrane protein assembly factor BamB family protein n=1 Tax=Nocardia sp. NPDC052566 TaxID=3364330 RepID=UPI0037C7659C